MHCLSENVSIRRSLFWGFPIGLPYRRPPVEFCGLSSPREVTSSVKNRRSVSVAHRLQRCGVATIEFAVVAPFILFIIFGAVEFARMMMVKQALTSAAREGCRHATLVTTQDSGDSESFVREILAPTIANSNDTEIVTINIEPSFSTTIESGETIVMAIEVACSDITWLPEMFLCGAKIRGSASMSRE